MFIQKNFKIRYGATMTRGDNDNEKYGIIQGYIGGTKYSFKTVKNHKYLKKKIYEANYKLIKFCPEHIWNILNK